MERLKPYFVREDDDYEDSSLVKDNQSDDVSEMYLNSARDTNLDSPTLFETPVEYCFRSPENEQPQSTEDAAQASLVGPSIEVTETPINDESQKIALTLRPKRNRKPPKRFVPCNFMLHNFLTQATFPSGAPVFSRWKVITRTKLKSKPCEQQHVHSKCPCVPPDFFIQRSHAHHMTACDCTEQHV